MPSPAARSRSRQSPPAPRSPPFRTRAPKTSTRPDRRSIRRSVLVREPPLPVDEHRLEIVVGIGALVSRRAIANLQVHDVFRGLVGDLMGVPVASPESRAHPRRQPRPALVGAQRGMALQHVQELILPAVRMPQRETAPGARRVRLTPKLLSPNTSPSG